MRASYLALLRQSPSDHPDLADRIRARTGAGRPLRISFESERALVVTCKDQALLAGPCGIIVGTLFRRGEGKPVRRLESSAWARFAHSNGSSLVEGYWGSYVAILVDEASEQTIVLRAPFGELPCLLVQRGRSAVAASSVDLLQRLAGYRPTIAWDAVRRHLAVRDIRFRETCLEDVQELHGGERLRLGRNHALDSAWTPWTFTERTAQICDEQAAVDAVRAATLESVGARASEFGHLVLMLSGGVDSSVVAASLAHRGCSFDCLTLTTRDPLGDERAYAAPVSAAVGRKLHVSLRDVERVNIGLSEAAGLPRPAARAFAQESARAASELAAETGARAIFTGGGGDNVFCSLQSGAPVADHLLVGGPGPGVWATSKQVAQVASASLPAVWMDALRRAWFGKRSSPRPCNGYLLCSRAVDAAANGPVHPWLDPPGSLLPGKAGHVRLLAYALGYVESLHAREGVAAIAPLLGQPLVEACLRIPTWLWFDTGRNRSIVRRAFAGELPPGVVNRRSKGSPESFVAEVFNRHRTSLAELLLDGMLVNNEVADRQAIEAGLTDPRPAGGGAFRRILELGDVEAWLRSWRV